MIAENNEVFSEATQTLYRLNADEILKEQCRAREDYEAHERYTQRKLKEQAETIEAQSEEIKAKDARIAELEAMLLEKNK